MAMENGNTVRQHARTGPAEVGPEEPTHAERVRTLVERTKAGVLSTWSKKVAGFPFGSLMPYALDAEGRPVVLISAMAMHTQNLRADGRASLFATQASMGDDALGAARATLVGDVAEVPEEDVAAVRERYLAVHENSRYWVDFADFRFFRMEVREVYYVGGFGVMGWVEAREYAGAEVDPLAEAAAGILEHMNADHVEAMVLLARVHGGLAAEEATMTGVDRLGFSMRVKTAEGMKGVRVNFPGEVRSAAEVRAALVGMVRSARG